MEGLFNPDVRKSALEALMNINDCNLAEYFVAVAGASPLRPGKRNC